MEGKVLIADDVPEVRHVIGRALRAKGYRILEASDGVQAIEMYRREEPSVVLLDIHMPRMDGIAVLDAIQEIAPGTAVIMITGDDDPAQGRMTIEHGACDFVLKPLDIEYLVTSVCINQFVRA